MTGNERLTRVLGAIAEMPEKDQLAARKLARGIWAETRKGKRSTILDGEELGYMVDLEPRAALSLARRQGPALAEALGLVGEYVAASYSRGSGVPFGGGRVQAGGYRGAYSPAALIVKPRR